MESLHQKKTRGNTDLMLAAASGDLKATRQMLARGANANAKNHVGSTALMGAAAGGFNDVVQSLLGARAQVNHDRFPIRYGCRTRIARHAFHHSLPHVQNPFVNRPWPHTCRSLSTLASAGGAICLPDTHKCIEYCTWQANIRWLTRCSR